MTPTKSKRLKIGQRVAWHDSADDQGMVSASDWSGVRIEWDNGKNQFFHHNNMGEVEVAKPDLAQLCLHSPIKRLTFETALGDQM
jgi:hypothetical protein